MNRDPRVDEPAAAPQPRPRCPRCRRPLSVCYCAALPRLETRTRVVILQHPRERDMPIGTARMASLALPGAALHVGVRWDDHGPLRAALADPARPPILLYPGPGARDILRDPPAGPVTLVAVDGTWSQARTVVRDNPVLAALPRYAFAAPEPSRYRIRREPRAEYCSTIEALMHVLGALEGDVERFRALLAPFEAMIDAHLAAQGGRRELRLRKPRPPRRFGSRLPAALTARPDDLLCVVGEANAWPYDAAERAGGDELVHWVARRVGTGEQFAMVAAPRGPLCPSTTFHVRLGEDRLRAGVDRDALVAAFAGFVRPTDVVCAWGDFAPRLFDASGGALPAERIDLRAVAHRVINARMGSLEDVAARVVPGGAPPPVTEGRAGARLAMLCAIVEAWRARAAADDASADDASADDASADGADG
ncbi:MAG: DTW domain-containing protein [Kofleriaceae bacterium]|nr:DTW domain-containing protein [Kofleriaceae bacterium]